MQTIAFHRSTGGLSHSRVTAEAVSIGAFPAACPKKGTNKAAPKRITPRVLFIRDSWRSIRLRKLLAFVAIPTPRTSLFHLLFVPGANVEPSAKGAQLQLRISRAFVQRLTYLVQHGLQMNVRVICLLDGISIPFYYRPAFPHL